MEKRRCVSGCKLFHSRAQSPDQTFQSTYACQRERKRRWQKAWRTSDADYRDNDTLANLQWRCLHPAIDGNIAVKTPEWLSAIVISSANVTDPGSQNHRRSSQTRQHVILQMRTIQTLYPYLKLGLTASFLSLPGILQMRMCGWLKSPYYLRFSLVIGLFLNNPVQDNTM